MFHSLCIEFGHRIRSCINNDICYIETLKTLLPPYEGESVQVYRGENTDRYKNKLIGISWTPQIDIARMFGRGLNAFYGEGGLLLSAWASTEAIIASPNDHSRRLGEEEYVIDPLKLTRLQIVEHYPRIS